MNGRRDAAAAPLLTLRALAPRTTAGRCQLSRPRETRGAWGKVSGGAGGPGTGHLAGTRKREKSRREGTVHSREKDREQSEWERGERRGKYRERKRLNGYTAHRLYPAPALFSCSLPASPRSFVSPHSKEGEYRGGFQQMDPGPLLSRRR